MSLDNRVNMNLNFWGGARGERQRARHLFGLCRGPKGVQRRLGIKALLVFANILTMLYKKFARLQG